MSIGERTTMHYGNVYGLNDKEYEAIAKISIDIASAYGMSANTVARDFVNMTYSATLNLDYIDLEFFGFPEWFFLPKWAAFAILAAALVAVTLAVGI